MARKSKIIPGPSRLSGILAQLKKEPRPSLVAVKRIELTLAARNDHFGARHFVKEDLPRIRYANPNIDIEVKRVPKSLGDTWRPEIVIERNNGKTETIDMSAKWSSTILGELLDSAGGTAWQRWKTERTAKGLPIIEDYGRIPEPQVAPGLTASLRTGSTSMLPKPRRSGGQLQGEVSDQETVTEAIEKDIERARSGSGAAAILPA